MNNTMIDTREVILALKQVRQEKDLSFDKILALMEKNGEYLSKSTLSRVFADGSEEKSFRYGETLRPIANAILDIENIETDDDIDTQAYKSLLKLKKDLIFEYAEQNRQLKAEIESLKQEYEKRIKEEKLKYHDKLEKERSRYNSSIEFLKEQVSLKDKRMDMMFEAIFIKNAQHDDIMNAIKACPLRKDED